MPDRKPGITDNNGWGHLIRKHIRTSKKETGSHKISFTIQTSLKAEYVGHKHAGEIHVQYFDGPSEPSVCKGMNKILANNKGVQEFANKYGDMTAAGLRIDLVSSTMTCYYTPKKGNKPKVQMLKE